MKLAAAQKKARKGRRIRHDEWSPDTWVTYEADTGAIFDESGSLCDEDVFGGTYTNENGWRVLVNTTELKARLAEAKASVARETERRECAERCMAQLQTELAEAEERAKVAEVENARLRVAVYDYNSRFGAKSLDADMRRSRDVVAADRDRLAAEVATLTAECERLRAAAPRFAVGDRVVLKNDTYRPRTVMTVQTLCCQVGTEHGYSFIADADLQPAPDSKPAEPTWYPCSAADAREKHAAGMRVRLGSGNAWLIGGRLQGPDSTGSERLEVLALRDLARDAGAHGWQWADPLPETEGGAK